MSDIKFNEINKLVKEIGEKHSSAPKGFAFQHRNSTFVAEDAYGVNAEEINKSIYEVTKSPLYKGGKFDSESISESILNKLSPNKIEEKKADVEQFVVDVAEDLVDSLKKNKAIKSPHVFDKSNVEFKYKNGTYQFYVKPIGSKVEVVVRSFGKNPKVVDQYFKNLVDGKKFDPTSAMYSDISGKLAKQIGLAVEEASLEEASPEDQDAPSVIKMSKTYQIVSPESAKEGGTEEDGFEFEDQEYDSVEDLADDIKAEGPVEASSYPVRKPYAGTYFSTVDPEQDYEDGTEKYYAFHPEGLSDEQWEELFKLLGIKVRTESKISEREGTGFVENYPDLAKKLKATMQKVMDKVSNEYVMSHGDDEPKEVDHKSRDGFISSNDGGYEQALFADSINLQGYKLPSEAMAAIDDIQVPEGEDEELPEDQVMFQTRAFVDFKGGPSWTVQGVINWEHPYFRPGKGNEVFKQIEIEFDDLEDMKQNFNKVLVAVAKCGKFLMGEGEPGKISEEEDEFKKLDRLQMEIGKLMKSGSDEDWKKAMEIKKEADALFSKLYDVRGMKESEEDLSDMYEIVDMGWENPSYFQGFGTYGSKWSDSLYEVGYTARDAIDNLLQRLHELDTSEAVKDAIAAELEADLVKAGKEADKDWYDHSGDERPEDDFEPMEEMMYHIGVRVKKEKDPSDQDEPLTPFFANVPKKKIKEAKPSFSSMQAEYPEVFKMEKGASIFVKGAKPNKKFTFVKISPEGQVIVQDQDGDMNGYHPSMIKKVMTKTEVKESDDEDEVEDDYIGPSEDDAVFSSTGRLGSKTQVSVDGKVIFTGDHEEAEDALRAWGRQNPAFRPAVWQLSDHGNYHLIQDFDWDDAWIIKDWAGNLIKDKSASGLMVDLEFDTADEAEDWLSDKLSELEDEEAEEARGEYEIVRKSETKVRDSRYLDPKDPRGGGKKAEALGDKFYQQASDMAQKKREKSAAAGEIKLKSNGITYTAKYDSRAGYWEVKDPNGDVLANFTANSVSQLKKDFAFYMRESKEVSEAGKFPHMGFDKLAGKLKRKGVDDPEALAASILRKKFGKKTFQAAAAAGRKKQESKNDRAEEYRKVIESFRKPK